MIEAIVILLIYGAALYNVPNKGAAPPPSSGSTYGSTSPVDRHGKMTIPSDEMAEIIAKAERREEGEDDAK